MEAVTDSAAFAEKHQTTTSFNPLAWCFQSILIGTVAGEAPASAKANPLQSSHRKGKSFAEIMLSCFMLWWGVFCHPTLSFGRWPIFEVLMLRITPVIQKPSGSFWFLKNSITPGLAPKSTACSLSFMFCQSSQIGGVKREGARNWWLVWMLSERAIKHLWHPPQGFMLANQNERDRKGKQKQRVPPPLLSTCSQALGYFLQPGQSEIAIAPSMQYS